MTLAYLDFDYNEDAQGHGCWDAMACVATQRLPAVLQEVTTVLSWAQAQAGLVRGAWEEGGDWDAVLQVQTEDGQPDAGQDVLQIAVCDHGLGLSLGPICPFLSVNPDTP